MLCSLATDLDDPVERLLEIHEGTSEAKAADNAIGADTLHDWVEFAAPALFGRAGAAVLAHADGRPPPAALQRDDLERARPAVPACTPRAHG